MNSSLPGVNQPSRALAAAPRFLQGLPLWKQALVFMVGFCIQFNILVGGNGEGASAVGGYGYRLLDFVALGAACLLGIHSLVPVRDERTFTFAPYRVLPLILYAVAVGMLFAGAALSPDSRTAILAYHYILYCFAGLYVAVVINDVRALERFCWGLIIGLLGTIPVFVAENSAFASKLTEWGLVPGYTPEFGGIVRDLPRYAGLSGHPNEAGHVAALSTAAGAYFALVKRRFLPVALVSLGLITVFYYTWSRGAIIAGSATLAIPFLIPSGRARVLRLIIMSSILVIVVTFASQLDFITYRFGDDPNVSYNIADRFASILSGAGTMLAHPFGMSIYEFISHVASGSGGVNSPHNGFIFFGGVFGLLPLAVMLIVFVSNLSMRDNVDVFFALLTFQVSLSLMFEQLPGDYPYAFAICLICARAFSRTSIGNAFAAHSVQLPPKEPPT